MSSPSSRPSCASRSRRSSTTSPYAASRPACWPPRPSWPTVAGLAAEGRLPQPRRRPGAGLLHRAPADGAPTGSRPTSNCWCPTRSSSPRTCARRPSSPAPMSGRSSTSRRGRGVAEQIRARGRPLRRGEGRPPHRFGRRRRGRPRRRRGPARAAGGHRATTTARAARCLPPWRPTWRGASTVLDADRARPRRSSPGRWPAARAGGSEPGTAPSTISGGRRGRRLARA